VNTVDHQIEVVSRFLSRFGGGLEGFRPEDIPAAPTNYSSRSILAVYLPDTGEEVGIDRTREAWWEIAPVPSFYRKDQWRAGHLHLVQGYNYRPGVYWLQLDMSAYKGISAVEARERAQIDGVQLAALEPLMAMSLWEDYMMTWFRDGIMPSMSSLQSRLGNEALAGVPFIGWWDALRWVELRANSASAGSQSWSSPIVEEC